MALLFSLWLPILLSSVFVFVASSIIHMMLPYHKGDYKKVPAQDDVMDALRKFNIPPGDYMLPRCDSMEEMRSAAFKEKMKKGPVVMMTVMPSGQLGIGSQLVQWFIYCMVIGVFAAYVTSRALVPGAPYLVVFRFAGTVAFAGYALALAQFSIWYRRSWRTTIVSMFDGLIYACLTAGTFGWLWPK
jgi:Flp pilus assembly protein TadB